LCIAGWKRTKHIVHMSAVKFLQNACVLITT
jgi:hypothetical protein